MDVSQLHRGGFSTGEQSPSSVCGGYTLDGTQSLAGAASLFHWGRVRGRGDREDETFIWWGMKMEGYIMGEGSGGIKIPQSSEPPPGEGDQRDQERDLFHPRTKSLPPPNFLCSPPRKFNWQPHDRERHICILQTSAFTWSNEETTPPRRQHTHTHTALWCFLSTLHRQ